MGQPRIGLIQSRGLGDIIIALPIAKYFCDRGFDVYWPIDRRFLPSFNEAVPYARFLPLEPPTKDGAIPYFLDTPLAMLRELGCETIHVLYSALGDIHQVVDQGLALFLSFDRYKYAIAGVPFREKWNLSIVRNHARERALFDRLVRQENYVVCQFESAGFKVPFKMDIPEGTQVIHTHEATDSLFDWLLILERASMLILIDSCFANLVEQLGISAKRKLFLPRSPHAFTPIFTGDWEYYSPTGGGGVR